MKNYYYWRAIIKRIKKKFRAMINEFSCFVDKCRAQNKARKKERKKRGGKLGNPGKNAVLLFYWTKG
jgi:hypothetical protein